jgi:hypothetical protein
MVHSVWRDAGEEVAKVVRGESSDCLLVQDWNYVSTSDMEITVEVSFDKYPPASQLASYCEDNRASLYNYVLQVCTCC